MVPEFSLAAGRGLLLLLLPVAAIELLACLFFHVYCSRFSFCTANVAEDSARLPTELLLSDAKMASLKKSFDPDLGWLKKYPTQYGERPRRKEYANPLMSVYGDSFTHCDQVRSAETWEEKLARSIKRDIYNFGVGGYGTDQAYLRFKREFSQIRTPLVGLGLITENINRVVNVYRPFYYARTAGGLPKPRLRLKNGQLELIRNPIQTPDEIVKLRDPSFIAALGENDWWYSHARPPQLEFPYTFVFFNKRFWLELRHVGDGREINDSNPRPWENLWQQAWARDLMFGILDAFVTDAKALDAVPVILILPRRAEVLELRSGTYPENAALLLDFCKVKGYRCFDGISALGRSIGPKDNVPQRDGAPSTESADVAAKINSFFRPHLSPKGNKLIARALKRFLTEEGLLSGS